MTLDKADKCFPYWLKDISGPPYITFQSQKVASEFVLSCNIDGHNFITEDVNLRYESESRSQTICVPKF